MDDDDDEDDENRAPTIFSKDSRRSKKSRSKQSRSKASRSKKTLLGHVEQPASANTFCSLVTSSQFLKGKLFVLFKEKLLESKASGPTHPAGNELTARLQKYIENWWIC